MFKQWSDILRFGGIWTLSCPFMTSKMCSVGLKSCELNGQNINYNLVSCSRNHFNRIRVLWHWPLSCWNISFQVGKTDAMCRLLLSSIPNIVCYTMCSYRFLIGPELYSAVIWDLSKFTKGNISYDLFLWKQVNVQHHVVCY